MQHAWLTVSELLSDLTTHGSLHKVLVCLWHIACILSHHSSSTITSLYPCTLPNIPVIFQYVLHKDLYLQPLLNIHSEFAAKPCCCWKRKQELSSGEVTGTASAVSVITPKSPETVRLHESLGNESTQGWTAVVLPCRHGFLCHWSLFLMPPHLNLEGCSAYASCRWHCQISFSKIILVLILTLLSPQQRMTTTNTSYVYANK